MKIYLASSYRNSWQPHVVALLRRAGHKVYDFKDGISGFEWDEIDPEWENWDETQARAALEHTTCWKAFSQDYEAMQWAEAFVLLLPSNRSAHLEAGWAIGQGKPTVIYTPEPTEPELMYLLADAVVVTERELLWWLASVKATCEKAKGDE